MVAEDRARFEQHLLTCPGCATYFDQVKKTVALTGVLREESLSGDKEKELLGLFRRWKQK
jgi:anti-sigma factor RsiW